MGAENRTLAEGMTLWEAQAVDGVTGVLRSVEGLPWGNFLRVPDLCAWKLFN
jgi:hypothetical protein